MKNVKIENGKDIAAMAVFFLAAIICLAVAF